MTITELYRSVQELKAIDKAKLVEFILADLDRPDPAIEQEWIAEVRRRQAQVESGEVTLLTREQVLGKYL